MVEENADPEVVTSRILRETREAREGESTTGAGWGTRNEGVLSVTNGVLAVESTPPPPPPPIDSETAFRRGRLGVVAAIVLVLLWLWLRERRASS